MSFNVDIDLSLRRLRANVDNEQKMLERFRAEIDFGGKLAQAYPEKSSEWQSLLLQAVDMVHTGGITTIAAAETLLAPLGAIAKRYTVHCVGHAHIDMNWMWSWPETVATTNDTFTTVDRLMDEYPEFTFSQSQTSVYQILKDYLPELYERVKARVASGRWEVNAAQWVEGDKNLANGEIITRHLLYSKRFFAAEFGLPFDDLQVCWEPDTFGHARTTPSLLAAGGVKYYYFCRGHNGKPQLFWWQGKDGARVLAFDDFEMWYNGTITPPDVTRRVLPFAAETGCKDYLFVYGVGDHGGGPTRRDLNMILDMANWPIFPQVQFSTAAKFFNRVEETAQNLPVVDTEMNYVFEGCYTSQSNIKYANRKSENALTEAETFALLGRGVGIPYPTESLYKAWRHAMLNQFHDILPGSGVKATYQHAQGLFQEIITETMMAKTRALRALADRVDTSLFGPAPEEFGNEMSMGAGQGNIGDVSSISRRGPGACGADYFLTVNPHPWPVTQIVKTRIWDRDYQNSSNIPFSIEGMTAYNYKYVPIVVKDDAGNILPVQVTKKDKFWGHQFTEVAFPAKNVPGIGYRGYMITRNVEPPNTTGCICDGHGHMENEFYSIDVEPASGAIIHLVDKSTGIDFVPQGGRIGVLEYVQEAPHESSAWVIGQPLQVTPFTTGGLLRSTQVGPYIANVQSHRSFKDSSFVLTISLNAGSPVIDFHLKVNWLERGSQGAGVPSLLVAFPLALTGGVSVTECANGAVTREQPNSGKSSSSSTFMQDTRNGINGLDAPCLQWTDLSGVQNDTPVGATLYNESKYGYYFDDNTMRLTLLRSTYQPDPLPELGEHEISFALQPHVGALDVSAATRSAREYNLPLNIVGTGAQQGDLPLSAKNAEILNPNIMLSCLKKAEDSTAIIIRLYEMAGVATSARVRLSPMICPADASAVASDVLERPLPENSASFTDGLLTVEIAAFGTATVRIGN